MPLRTACTRGMPDRPETVHIGTSAQRTGVPPVFSPDLLEQRRDAPAEAARRPEAVHVYGVDVLSSADLLRYFGDYGPTYVEWINDSSCNVLFADDATALRAVAGVGQPLAPDQLPAAAAEGERDAGRGGG